MSSFEVFARTKGRYLWAAALFVAIAATFLPFLALPGTLTLHALLGKSLGPGMSFYLLANTLGMIVEGAAVLGVDPSMQAVAMAAGWVVCALWIVVIACMAYLAVSLIRRKPYKFAPVLVALIVATLASLLFLVIPSVANPAFSGILGSTFGSTNIDVEIFDWTPWQLIVFIVSVCSLFLLFYSRKLAKAETPETRAALEAVLAERASAKEAKQTAKRESKEQKKQVKEEKRANRTPQQKRNKRIVVGTVVGVIAAAAIGFNVWHAQPTFCNAVCHSPMDGYVEGYYSGDDDLLVTAHANANVNCLMCHNPHIDEQINEVVKWTTGDFSDPLEVSKLGTRDFCLRCHGDSDASNGIDWDDIVAATAGWGGDAEVNPHSSHNGQMECGLCHSSHGVSVLWCNQCHDMEVPDGWAGSIDEAAQIQIDKQIKVAA